MLCSFVWCWHCGIFSLREIASASLLARQITFFSSLILTPDFYLWFNRKFKEIRKVPKNRTAQKKTPAKFILMRIICTARYTCDRPEFSKDNCMRLHLFGGFFFPLLFFSFVFLRISRRFIFSLSLFGIKKAVATDALRFIQQKPGRWSLVRIAFGYVIVTVFISSVHLRM